MPDTVSIAKSPVQGMAQAQSGKESIPVCQIVMFAWSHKVMLFPALTREAVFSPVGGGIAENK